MPMGIVNDDEFKSELERADKSVPQEPIIVQIPKGGRNKGDVNVPDGLRKIIGDEAVTNGRKSALELAASLGISESSVSAYSNGVNSTATYNSPDPGLKKAVRSASARIAVKARNRLNQTLNEITPEKLGKAKLRDLATVATAMSHVIKQMEPSDSNSDVEQPNRPVVVLFAPRVKTEDEYETIVVNE